MGRRRIVLAVVAAAAVLVLVGAAVMVATGGTPSRTPVASVAAPSAAGSGASGSDILDQTPAPGGTDDDDIPPASFTLPPVDISKLPMNCDAATVPSASPAPSFTSGPDMRLRLHVPILEYHRIVPWDQAGKSLRSLVVPPNIFDEQMHALSAAGWHTITAAQLAEDLRAAVVPPHKTVVVTFDDGWWDGYTYALPALQKYGFVGTFYVITGRIGQSDGMTADQWNALIAAGNEIGDHTVTHLPLGRLPFASARSEVIRAAQKIAEVTGRWPETLAYPYGSFDLATIDIMDSCHPFLMAVTTQRGAIEAWATRFESPRIKITSGVSGATLLVDVDPYR